MRYEKDKKVYQYKEDHFKLLVSDILHFIKYNEEESKFYWESDCKKALENIKSLTESEFRNLCIIATFVDVAYEMKRIYKENWSKDSQLVMPKAHMDKSVRPLDFFTAYQSEFDHNVFFVKSAYEVL